MEEKHIVRIIEDIKVKILKFLKMLKIGTLKSRNAQFT